MLPQREEGVVRGASLGRVAAERIGARQAQASECGERIVQHDTAMVEEFLELPGGLPALRAPWPAREA